MKINDMTAKTSLEIQDTDILVIQDGEDTKQVSVADLRDFLNITSEKNTKKLINQTIDNVIASLQATKYIVSELRSFMINSWIGSTSGNIQIAIKDINTDKWLTTDEIIALTNPDENGMAQNDFIIKVMVADVYNTAISDTIMDFNTEHPSGTNAILEASNAGFIKAHFNGLIPNEIAGITYDDIKLELPETEEYRYLFNGDPDSFANAVPYTDNI